MYYMQYMYIYIYIYTVVVCNTQYTVYTIIPKTKKFGCVG